MLEVWVQHEGGNPETQIEHSERTLAAKHRTLRLIQHTSLEDVESLQLVLVKTVVV